MQAESITVGEGINISLLPNDPDDPKIVTAIGQSISTKKDIYVGGGYDDDAEPSITLAGESGNITTSGDITAKDVTVNNLYQQRNTGTEEEPILETVPVPVIELVHDSGDYYQLKITRVVKNA
jgi:hypothetical protein